MNDKETLDKIEEILKPEWTHGKIMPAYVGAHSDARIRAIETVIAGRDR